MNSATVEASLLECLGTLQAAFARAAPNLKQRRQSLAALAAALRRHEVALQQAVDEDFGGRSSAETQLLELLPLHDQIRHARKNLARWMRRRAVCSSWFLLPSRAFYQYQPLGVAGIIGAWNYPFLLTLGPLIDAIAAGNHAMVKPSELAPRSAEIIGRIISEAFPPDQVTCVTGGAEVARRFSNLPFDHLFFTGSTRIGRLVMQAASANLTPVTLELGGKSPAIIHDSYPMKLAVDRIMTAKLLNAGQTCVAPDYVVLPSGQEDEFERLALATVTGLYPRLDGNPDYTHMVNNAHYARMLAMISDATAKGARIVTLASVDEDAAAKKRIVAPTLVFGATPDMTIMQEEIFGPLLPVVTTTSLEAAIAYVNAMPKPLALYYFDNDPDRQNQMLSQTLSGGVTINDCIYHLGQHNLPFGGVGPSGMGHYHGFDGFVTFSKKRAVMVQRHWAATSLLHAPWSKRKWLVRLLMGWVSRS
jgi:coniferyl-aldehyde dehydrogenase